MKCHIGSQAHARCGTSFDTATLLPNHRRFPSLPVRDRPELQRTITDFSEMEFVVPRSRRFRRHLRKCFSDLGGLTEADLIRVVTERQEARV